MSLNEAYKSPVPSCDHQRAESVDRTSSVCSNAMVKTVVRVQSCISLYMDFKNNYTTLDSIGISKG